MPKRDNIKQQKSCNSLMHNLLGNKLEQRARESPGDYESQTLIENGIWHCKCKSNGSKKECKSVI